MSYTSLPDCGPYLARTINNWEFIQEHILNQSGIKSIPSSLLGTPFLFTIVDNTSDGPEWVTITSKQHDEYSNKQTYKNPNKLSEHYEEYEQDSSQEPYVYSKSAMEKDNWFPTLNTKKIVHVVCEIKEVPESNMQDIMDKTCKDIIYTMDQKGIEKNKFQIVYENGYSFKHTLMYNHINNKRKRRDTVSV